MASHSRHGYIDTTWPLGPKRPNNARYEAARLCGDCKDEPSHQAVPRDRLVWADVGDGRWLKSNVDAEHSSRLRFDGLTPANAYCSPFSPEECCLSTLLLARNDYVH